MKYNNVLSDKKKTKKLPKKMPSDIKHSHIEGLTAHMQTGNVSTAWEQLATTPHN